jgi:hypothetical protein
VQVKEAVTQPVVKEEPKPTPAPVIVVPTKTFEEIELESKLKSLNSSSDALLDIVNKIKADRITETLLKEFISKCDRKQDNSDIISVDLFVVQRLDG